MCGIAGVRKFGNTPINGEELVLLLCSLEHRGNHATGVAIETDEGLKVFKQPKPAAIFTRTKEFAEFLDANLTADTRTVLLHTRWATTGSPLVNDNNHPMFDGDTAIVHNGHISNHWNLFQDKDYTRSCETDSDIIRAIITKHGISHKGIRELCKMGGSAAVAALSTTSPDKLLLARSGSPLVFGFNSDDSKLYWASEAQAILRASKPYRKIHGIWVYDTKANVSIGSMPDNTAWIIGPEGLETNQAFTVCMPNTYHAPDYTKGRETYHAKSKAWKREQKAKNNKQFALPASTTARTAGPAKNAVASCPGCGRGVLNVDGVPWSNLTCPTCHAVME